MNRTKKVESLQIGNVTEENSPVAAVIEMNGMYSIKRLYFRGEDAESIISGLHKYQDLYCLCRMAPAMGTKEDAAIALDLEKFLFSSYDIEDFDRFDFPFSIGRIRCLGWAKGGDNVEKLRVAYEEKKV